MFLPPGLGGGGGNIQMLPLGGVGGGGPTTAATTEIRPVGGPGANVKPAFPQPGGGLVLGGPIGGLGGGPGGGPTTAATTESRPVGGPGANVKPAFQHPGGLLVGGPIGGLGGGPGGGPTTAAITQGLPAVVRPVVTKPAWLGGLLSGVSIPSGTTSKPDKPKKKKKKKGINYSWTQALSSGQSAAQKLFAPKNTTIINLTGKGQKKGGFLAAKVLYDFGGSHGVMAIKIKGKNKCYFRNTSRTYQDILDEASGYDGNKNTAPLSQVTVEATGKAVIGAKKNQINAEFPEVKKFCGKAALMEAALPGVLPAYKKGTKDIKTVTFDEELSITIRFKNRKKNKKGKTG